MAMATFPIVTSAQRTVVAVAIVNIICPVVAISLRFLSHRIAHRKVTSSDYCAAIAALCAVAFQALLIAGVVVGGVGYDHASNINKECGLEPIHTLFKFLDAIDALWTISLSASRISMLLLYSKLFRDSYMVIASRITIVLIILWALPTVVINFLICQPFTAAWTQSEGEVRHCGDRIALFLSTAVLNLASDFTVVVLPLPHLYRLRLPKNTKVGLAIVMSLGVLTCLISILRILFMHNLRLDDITWTLPLVSVFSGLESSMAATLCCVPLLKPLLSLSKHMRIPSRVKVIRNTLHTQQYDPDEADKLKLRGDKVSHTAEVVVEASMPRETAGFHRRMNSDGSGCDLKDGAGSEITVNKEWRVTSEAGDWTQILGTR